MVPHDAVDGSAVCARGFLVSVALDMVILAMLYMRGGKWVAYFIFTLCARTPIGRATRLLTSMSRPVIASGARRVAKSIRCLTEGPGDVC